ncbi:multidrug efflux MATE transporter FepA [Listeria swaminathanii]|uniref:Multidrug export protein MepA n=1 Tax=Listeria swaminathanii TaxID=2713501 RepID=A0A7X1DP95_9LIST|nr:multidrug efflux MATE transporter FepA [Listeria swaminathanii]MBC2330104.1 multidrug efflux MATE transporter FepA [Listeria swaminathanii]MDT0017529.1 multidrug efflux MATE transporter FepA [Listeria swaminathanii]MDT0022618.1 multidrug efflux MATE transporter FepA [Listeria swaminathanii]MDT0033582.1 multidrug efflux MATE transporter FepA [Listeria swaminathanii]MDT0052466.1 multidrug efflux MATE transporter FepA [Listeria swaminathanii]
MAKNIEILETDSVKKIYFRYLVPSLVGMLLMSLNIVIDGIFVGHKLGGVALAGINIAVPVFTIFTAISIWIGIGAATQFSFAIGEKNVAKAQTIFTNAILAVVSLTIIIGIIAFIFKEPLAYFLGANDDTIGYVLEYMNILLIFGFALTLENILSIFVRNDGDPNLSMIALIVTAISNVILNYLFLFVFEWGVTGSALATMLAIIIGVFILITHFFKKSSRLKFVKVDWNKAFFKKTLSIGLPSFLAEVGVSVFTLGYNISIAAIAGTAGVAAFSVLNYTHSVILMLFLGMGSAIQPLISYYRGAKARQKELETLKIAIIVAFSTGVGFLLVGLLGSNLLVSMFGNFSPEIRELASNGIKLFYTAYLFMGFNFVMMTYFQTSDKVKMATWITISREIIFMVIFLLVLPPIIGIPGVWLAIPISEMIVAASIVFYMKKKHILFK